VQDAWNDAAAREENLEATLEVAALNDNGGPRIKGKSAFEPLCGHPCGHGPKGRWL